MSAAVLALVMTLANQLQPLGPGDHLRVLDVDKLARTYWVHVPKNYDAAKRMPLVLALHGATMSAKTMEILTGLSKKADDAGFIVVYPNGTGPTPFLHTWNSGGFASYLSTAKPDDVHFVAKVLDDLEEVLNVDTKRVFATGMSNGAMMCYRLASEMSDRVAAIAPVSGTIAIDKYEPKRRVPVLHIHGTVDNLVPYDGPTSSIAVIIQFHSVADTITTCVKINGSAAEPKITEVPTTKDKCKCKRLVYEAGADGAEVILYVVDGGGHTWPGRPFGGGLLGRYTMNFQANDVIWEFFRRHPLP
jgi:polyhydroxybutyrate depolymerase